jgi:hypothetical protein
MNTYISRLKKYKANIAEGQKVENESKSPHWHKNKIWVRSDFDIVRDLFVERKLQYFVRGNILIHNHINFYFSAEGKLNKIMHVEDNQS